MANLNGLIEKSLRGLRKLKRGLVESETNKTMAKIKTRKELARLVYRTISSPKQAVEIGDRVIELVEKAIRIEQLKYKE